MGAPLVERGETRAVISVSDKTGIGEFAAGLKEVLPNTRIISTGNTAKALERAGIDVTPIEDITGFPEILGGRVKTLHPQIHGGILADLENTDHVEDLERHNITPIDFVVVSLYPFQKTVQKDGVTREEAIEQIDIGGVTLLRAAAKNADRVTVIFDPKDYEVVLNELRETGALSYETRARLACKAFDHTSRYDAAITDYLETLEGQKFARHLRLFTGEYVEFRYAENPHQQGVLYPVETNDPLAFYRYEVIQGKAMSYNNWLDLSAASDALSFLGGEKAACIIVKHTNPCGAAYAETIGEAFEKAWAGDALAAFGGIVAVNRVIDEALALQMTKGKFVEIIAAPGITDGAKKILANKGDLRVLINPALSDPYPSTDLSIRQIRGGILVQEPDAVEVTADDLEVVTEVAPTPEQIDDLLLAWQLCRTSKSNTITIVRDGMLVGSGVGQQDRKRCCELAASKAIDERTGSNRSIGGVAASDAFFPFRDGPEVLIRAGVTAIIQPMGSKRDQETIELCNKHRIAMVRVPYRGFKH